MAVITLTSFVVIPENALPLCDKGKAVLVAVGGPGEWLRK